MNAIKSLNYASWMFSWWKFNFNESGFLGLQNQEYKKLFQFKIFIYLEAWILCKNLFHMSEMHQTLIKILKNLHENTANQKY